MKPIRWYCTVIFAFSLSGCLEATKVARLTPAQDEQAAHSVTLSLPRTALADFGEVASVLTIHVFGVDHGALGAEVREAYQFPLTDNGLYVLQDLPLGELEFQVSLLDGRNQELAAGSLRAVIQPGEQTLPQLTLKPKKPTAVDVDLSLALNLVNFPDAPVQNPPEPEAVRNILKNYKCQSCHNAARPMASLDLQSYPYKNSKNESLPLILTRMLNALSGADGTPKMPPNSSQVTPEESATVSAFLQSVNDALSSGNKKWVQEVRLSLAMGGPGRFETTLKFQDGVYVMPDRLNLMAGSRYAYTLTVYGPGSSKLYEVVDAALDVPLDGKVQFKVDLNYQKPAVTLPVVVDPV